MKKIWLTHKEKLKKILGFLLFLILLINVYLFLTYLFRGNVYTYLDRITVTGIKEEKKNSLDVVCIGGSATLVYFEPLKAYRDYGFTSYDLATNGIQAESILAYLKYAQKYQKPDLYIIGVRAYQYYSEGGIESSLRISSDSLDIGKNRNDLIRNYLKNRYMDTDEVSLYFELAKYHNNMEALAKPEAWKLTDNSYKCDYKGFEIQKSWCYMEEPTDFKTEERANLPENDIKVMEEMLDYCKGQNLNVLFVVCPYYATREHYEAFNRIQDLVESYGYDFLNMNECYDEIGLNFAEDYYNINHVNAIGAEKYTDYLSKYVVEHYSLKDHRQDPAYEEWNQLSEDFVNTSEQAKQEVRQKIAYASEAARLYEKIREEDDFLSWAALVKDERYQLIVAGDGTGFSNISESNQMLLARIGLGDCYENPNYIRLVADGRTLVGNNANEETYTVSLGMQESAKECEIQHQDGQTVVTIQGDVKLNTETKGINILVYDYYYGKVLDQLNLQSQDGMIVIER